VLSITRALAVAAAGIMGVALYAGVGTGPAAAAPVSASSSGDLYYISAPYIERVPVSGGAPQRVVRAGYDSITGMAIADGRLYWVTQLPAGTVDYVALRGPATVHQLTGGLSFPIGLVSTGGWLYWADQNAIGRERPDGTQLNRRFLVLPQETGGGIAQGLATDGSHLFFSRCLDDEIGRVGLTGAGLDMSFIRLPRLSCPQQLTVGNDHLYWTELSAHVGRATLQGGGANITWLNIGEPDGPFNVAADNNSVYWDWGGEAGTPVWVGTARVAGTGVQPRFLSGQGAFLDTAPGAS
jgi:hypothetical protein